MTATPASTAAAVRAASRRPSRPASRRSSSVYDATVVYPGGHVALDHLSLEVARGEFAFIIGPTGCGKSTLIKMLIREIEPAAGTRADRR